MVANCELPNKLYQVDKIQPQYCRTGCGQFFVGCVDGAKFFFALRRSRLYLLDLQNRSKRSRDTKLFSQNSSNIENLLQWSEPMNPTWTQKH